VARAVSHSVRQAVVLAGGLGTRLGELTAETPKPLLSVGGRPFLEWVIANLEAQGVEEVILTVGYRAEAFEAWRSRAPIGVGLRVFVEEEPLGTGGALPRLGEWLDPTFLVLNGDTLFDAPLRALGALRAEASAVGALALRAVTDVARYGEVRLDGSVVRAFDEKGRTGPGLINGGVYVFAREVVERIPSPGSIERDLLPALAAEGSLVGLPSDGFFIDIGVPETFEDAQTAVARWWKESRG
jgi:D-glycero-D-manno-heptose 1,7-bisphosphate phosphatase